MTDEPSSSLIDELLLLHDDVSDMIEGGRLVREDIPDDYDALVHRLMRCADEYQRFAVA